VELEITDPMNSKNQKQLHIVSCK